MTEQMMKQAQKTVHVLGISGGKDSAALAVYMRDRQPDMQYYFCDTGEELAETYEYLAVLETFLGKPIKRLNPERDFKHYLDIYNNYLPSPRMRWCTAMLKLKPFENWLEQDFAGCQIKSYVAIRSDEDRDGYISHKPNIEAVYPFRETGVDKEEVMKILEEAGVGLPKYYEWRTRSGCYFCFFQRKSEWVGLKERHPDLYEKAKSYEKVETDPITGETKAYTWSQSESLTELEGRAEEIKVQHAKTMAVELERQRMKPKRLSGVFQLQMAKEDALDEEDDSEPCMICNL